MPVKNLIVDRIYTDAEMVFRDMMRQHQEEVYWYVRRMVISHADTDDILQNTFLKAWQGLPSFKGESSLKTWLFTIARNETYTFIKKNERYYKGGITVEEKLQNEAVSGFFDGALAEQLLQEAIAFLPERQKEIFLLKYYHEKTYDEIVELIGGSVGSHKASYHHANNKIKTYLKGKLNHII